MRPTARLQAALPRPVVPRRAKSYSRRRRDRECEMDAPRDRGEARASQFAWQVTRVRIAAARELAPGRPNAVFCSTANGGFRAPKLEGISASRWFRSLAGLCTVSRCGNFAQPPLK